MLKKCRKTAKNVDFHANFHPKGGKGGFGFLMAQMVKNPPAMQETGFDPWVGKIPWRRAWQPTSVFLPGESHGQRSLAGYSPWGRTESYTTERPALSLFILPLLPSRLPHKIKQTSVCYTVSLIGYSLIFYILKNFLNLFLIGG